MVTVRLVIFIASVSWLGKARASSEALTNKGVGEMAYVRDTRIQALEHAIHVLNDNAQHQKGFNLVWQEVSHLKSPQRLGGG